MRIAIVEDERLEREAIKYLVERCDIPTEVVYEAVNGEDAVALFRAHRPKLIFMDIQMPLQSGLLAAREILSIDPSTQIVLVTAYSDFTYAHQAIKLRVADYLLKPYNANALYQVLYKIHNNLEQKRKDEEGRLSRQRLISGIDKYMKRDLFYYMITGKSADDWTLEFLSEYFGSRRHEMRCMLITAADGASFQEEMAARVEALVYARFPQAICRVFQRNIVCLTVECCEHRETMRDISLTIENELGGGCKYYMGEPVGDLHRLPESFVCLLTQAAQIDKEAPLRSKWILNMYDLESELCKAALRMEWDECRRLLSALARMVLADNKTKRSKPVANHYFSHLWRQIDRVIFQVTGRRNSIDIKFTLDVQLENARDIDESIEIMMTFLRQYVERLGLDRHDYYHRAIERVKEYIDANLGGDLSLEAMAERFAFSSFYLSKLFRKIQGENYKNYIIRVRMENARQLLAKGDMNIAQVAQAVGYSNANYFRKAFKQYSGFSAKQMSSF